MDDSILISVLNMFLLKVTAVLKQFHLFQKTLELNLKDADLHKDASNAADRNATHFILHMDLSTPWTAGCQLEASPHCTSHAFLQLCTWLTLQCRRRSKEEIISQQQWDSLSASGLEPSISVKAAVIAKGPIGLEGLVVRAANLSQLQKALNFAKKQERQWEGWALCMWGWLLFFIQWNHIHTHTYSKVNTQEHSPTKNSIRNA